MQNKTRPGDTFRREVNGTTYDIRVMSVGERLDIEDQMATLTEATTARDHLTAWLDIVGRNVVGWDREEPIERLRYHVDTKQLGDLLDAVLAGNTPDEADQKN